MSVLPPLTPVKVFYAHESLMDRNIDMPKFANGFYLW